MTAPVREGDVLAGKYRVERVLGVGGMGVVVAAHHLLLDGKVAIKFLRAEALHNDDAAYRFAREARAAVKIKSEHVARVSDVGTLENGAPYMVMEYLEGADLWSWLKRYGRLPAEQVVEFMLQASEALAEAHTYGIVHRDLKPANLFVVKRPDGGLSVKVLDFGISKMTGTEGIASNMTQSSAVMGSPLYMSPEQMQSSKDADARSDIWALGVIMHELLTGESPFVAGTMPELVLKIMSAPPARLRDVRPEAPEGFERIILKCLEKDRNRRFQTVAELAVELVRFGPSRSKGSVERILGVMSADGSPSEPLPPASDALTATSTALGTAAPWAATASRSKRGRATFGIAGGVLVVAALFVVVRRNKPPAAEKEALSPSALGSVLPSSLASSDFTARPSAAPSPREPGASDFAVTPLAPSPSADVTPQDSKPDRSRPHRSRKAETHGASVPEHPLTPASPPQTASPSPGKVDVNSLIDDRQ